MTLLYNAFVTKVHSWSQLPPMNIHGRHDAILAGFILCSLLLHFLLLHFLPARRLTDLRQKEPVVVEVRPPQDRDRELDLPPQPDQPEPRKTPAKRLGPSDRTVPKEMAPKGDAPEDRLPVPKPPAHSKPPQPSSTTKSSNTASLPDPSAIDLNLAQNTRARYQEEWRLKYRKDVEAGDAVWLDTEKDILLSFFDRFRRNIYNVWNYPPQAAKRREQGVCLLEIIINRDGSVEAVKPLESSGFPTLDREAVAAVYRGAPYGQLPSAYTDDKLKIMAFFQYRLSLSGQRGGDIFGAR
jgi:protein TonB